jgi:hypothetical protein
MSFLDKAKKLAKQGFHVFPLIENGKVPALSDFTGVSTNDPNDLERFWYDAVLGWEHINNIGIATSKFQKDSALVVVDVDNKDGKEGSKKMLELEMQGLEFPKTLTQKTPTGGLHLIYKTKEPIKQGANVLGSGLDIRSRGGYIVGAGSLLNGKAYTTDSEKIAVCPQWIIDKCSSENEAERKALAKPGVEVNQVVAKTRALDFLQTAAPAVQGAGGDHTTYQVCTRLKDIGVDRAQALELLLDNWNETCQPPWNPDELEVKVKNAYAYGQNKQGIDSPEAVFSKIEPQEEGEKRLSPIEKLNQEYAFLVLGGKSTIVRRHPVTKKLSYMAVQAFHDLLKADKIDSGGKGRPKQVSNMWFEHHTRPTYYGAEMHPEKEAPEGVLNLWEGFAYQLPKDITPKMREGVRLFKEHLLENICHNDADLYKWLFGYFAHMFQRPWEKPLVSLVFKGGKGTGKNALLERLVHLIGLGVHASVASNRRFVVSNFNKHMEKMLFFVLDEAVWSGDKEAEGILKDLITGDTLMIEHKGKEAYAAKNYVRVAMTSNEKWVVPASEDERRFAVFKVGNKRQGDKKYFEKMRVLLDCEGGAALLLQELLEFDIKDIDINDAPHTEGLYEQKLQSLDVVHSWWVSCLEEGEILGDISSEFGGDWPKEMTKTALRDACISYSRKKGVKSWMPDIGAFCKELSQALPSAKTVRQSSQNGRRWAYQLPALKAARADFESFLRCEIPWQNEIDDIDESHIFT